MTDVPDAEAMISSYGGLVATYFLAWLPVQIVLASLWAHHPWRLAEKSRAVRGGILLATHADFFDHWPLPSAMLTVGTEAEELPGI